MWGLYVALPSAYLAAYSGVVDHLRKALRRMRAIAVIQVCVPVKILSIAPAMLLRLAAWLAEGRKLGDLMV